MATLTTVSYQSIQARYDNVDQSALRTRLGLVPPEEREICLNQVLQKEFSVLDEAVNGILAAFTKLEELRNVISKLERGSASIGGHSASLVTTMESTVALERQLEGKIRQIAAGIAAGIAAKAETERGKRKRNYEDHNRQPSQQKMVSTKSIRTGESSDMHQLEVRQETKIKTPSVIPSKITKYSAQPHHTAHKKTMVAKPPVYYVELVKEVDALPPQERICRIPEVLRELTVSLTEDTSYGQRYRVTSYLKDMISWVNKMVRQQFLDLFLIFIESEVFCKKTPEVLSKARSFEVRRAIESTTSILLTVFCGRLTLLLRRGGRLTDNLSAALHDKPIPSYSKLRNLKCR